MKTSKVTMNLERMARKSGSDRYEGISPTGTPFQIYVPQFISRPFSTLRVVKTFELSFTPKEIPIK